MVSYIEFLLESIMLIIMSTYKEGFVTDDFIVTKESIISRRDIKHIVRIPFTDTYKIVLNDDKHFINIDEKQFNNIKTHLKDNLERKCNDLEKENDMLKLHISLSPGGDEYIQVQEHFNAQKKYKSNES